MTWRPSRRVTLPSQVILTVVGAEPSSGVPRTRARLVPCFLMRALTTFHVPVSRWLAMLTPCT